MRTLAILMAAAVLVHAEERTRHAYDVAVLGAAHANYPGPDIGFPDAESQSGPIGIGSSDDDEEICWLAGEELVDLVRNNIDPDSWEDGRNSVAYQDGVLVVTTTKENHDRIRQYLGVLRARLYRTVVMEADVLLLAPGVLDAQAGSLLTAEQLRAIEAAAADPARGRLVSSLRAVATNGQRVHTSALTGQSYVRDYDIEIAQHQAIADPVVALRNDGYVLDVTPFIAHDGATVLVETRFAAADTTAILQFVTGEPTLGILEQPDVALHQTRTSLMLPPGRTAVLSSSVFSRGPRPGWASVVLLRAGIQADPLPADLESKEKRVLRAYDIAAITRNLRSYPGPKLGVLRLGGEAGTGAIFGLPEGADAGMVIDPDSLVELLRANVAPESWENRLNQASISGGQLLVYNSPEAQKQVEEFLGGLAAARAQLISVEGWLVALDESEWRARRGVFGGAEVGEAAWSELLGAAAKGETVRMVGSVRTLGQNGSRFHAARGAQRALVLDYDVEIAQGASALDPVVTDLCEGISLDVTPLMVGDGKLIQLDLRPSIVLAAEAQTFAMQPQGAKVQTMSLTDFGLQTQTLVAEGQPTLVGMTTRAEAGKKEVLLFFVRAKVVATK
ncbi:MAG: hypothetical protein HYY18_12540 [Planctomycetes bacterium]|nr:hypothetical protein [Planctomycetota bacterium]